MEDLTKIYISQRRKAKEALKCLEKQREEIYNKLKDNEVNPDLHKDLRSINMDIKITLNEIENVENYIKDFE